MKMPSGNALRNRQLGQQVYLSKRSNNGRDLGVYLWL